MKDSLRIATEHYYWKPGKGFFHSFELEEYVRGGVRFEHLVLDLGCSDGTFGAMLQERGIVDYIDIALDCSIKGLLQAKRNRPCDVVQADAMALPFKSGVFASVFSNGMLPSVRTDNETDIERVILETHRVLADPGLFVLTVHTPWFNRNLVLAEVLKQVGGPRLATRYLKRLERRVGHYLVFDEAHWLKKLESADFHVEEVRYFFTRRQGCWFSLLTVHVFRVFGFFKILGVSWVTRLVARTQEKVFRPVFLAEQSLTKADKRAQAGYLLIVARKGSLGVVQGISQNRGSSSIDVVANRKN